MLDKRSLNISEIYDWRLSKPVLRYVLGTCLILTITTLMGYPLSYLTSILALSFLAPGAKPLSFKQCVGFMVILSLLTAIAYFFSELFIDYPLVFIPLLSLGILWIYYTQKIPMIIKLFAIISALLIPLLALESKAIGGFVAMSLVFNTLMAITLTQFMYVVFPLSKEDDFFAKTKGKALKNNENIQFRYALHIMIVLLPLLLLFFIFKLSGGVLILMFVAILSFSPALSNVKTGAFMIVANIFGGLCAILAFKLLVIVPQFLFMVLLTLIVGLIFASNLFSSKKIAPIFGTGFSTFLLILGSVTSSEDAAGAAVWTRVVQITCAVIYVVVAFGLLNHFQKNKSVKN